MNKSISNNFCEFLDLENFNLLDIGASGGVEKKWKVFQQKIKIVSYEPDILEFEKLIINDNLGNNIYINEALGSNIEKSKLFITKKQQLSSVLRPDPLIINKYVNSERFDIVNEIDINLTTLDNSLRIAKVEAIDFIKIDTQGSELSILKGAIQILPTVIGIEIEVELNPIYKDQPIFSEVDIFIRNLGFELMELEPAYYLRKENNKKYPSSGQIMFANAIYFPNDETVNKKMNAAYLKKLIFISLVYRKYDYAFFLLNSFSYLLTKEIINVVYEYLDSNATITNSLWKKILTRFNFSK